MKAVRHVVLEFSSDNCTHEEINEVAKQKMNEVRSEIGLSGLIVVGATKSVIWHITED